MANIFRIKRSTTTAAPTSLENAELAYSESSNKLFIGVGTGGAGGSATSIVAIGGSGAYADLTSDQTVAGVKTFSSSPIVPTLTASDSSTKAASTAFVKAQGYLTSADLSGYLTTSSAASTYQTISGMSSYLTTATASSTYAPLASPTFTGTVTIPAGASISGYLTTSTASSTYAPIASPTFTGTVTIPAGASISGFAPLASPTFTGTPAAPTASANTNTTQVATTAFVLGQGNSTAATIAMNGTQAAGTSNLYARADHIHPSDTSKANLASPTFTGTPAAPTAAVDTNTTQVATTAFVIGQGYLKSATASSTYLTQSSAASTYQTQSGMSSYLTTSTASTTYAPLASPTLTGTPLAPTAVAGTNTTQIATTAYVTTAVSNLVNGAGAALDTLKELADALGNDASFSTTITTSIGTKLTKSSNLSDLTSVSTARTNLGLGSMAVQNASAVAITGGTIDGVTFDGGTF